MHAQSFVHVYISGGGWGSWGGGGVECLSGDQCAMNQNILFSLQGLKSVSFVPNDTKLGTNCVNKCYTYSPK